MKKVKLEHLLSIIYYDFFILVRTVCLFKKCDLEELRFCGQVADMIHNFPKCNVGSDYFRSELVDYSKFLDDVLSGEIILQKDIFIMYKKQLKLITVQLSEENKNY